jgi:hypothetical protein
VLLSGLSEQGCVCFPKRRSNLKSIQAHYKRLAPSSKQSDQLPTTISLVTALRRVYALAMSLSSIRLQGTLFIISRRHQTLRKGGKQSALRTFPNTEDILEHQGPWLCQPEDVSCRNDTLSRSCFTHALLLGGLPPRRHGYPVLSFEPPSRPFPLLQGMNTNILITFQPQSGSYVTYSFVLSLLSFRHRLLL